VIWDRRQCRPTQAYRSKDDCFNTFLWLRCFLRDSLRCMCWVGLRRTLLRRIHTSSHSLLARVKVCCIHFVFAWPTFWLNPANFNNNFNTTRLFAVIKLLKEVHCVSKNDTALACYNFHIHQRILIISGRNFAKKVSSQMLIYFLTSPDYYYDGYSCFVTVWNTSIVGIAQYSTKLLLLLHAATTISRGPSSCFGLEFGCK